MSALGTGKFPVPIIYVLCTDESVIGIWFYVMEHVEGRIFWESTFPGVPERDRARYLDAMNETLARLHGGGIVWPKYSTHS